MFCSLNFRILSSDMLDTRLVSVKKLVHTVEIPWEFLEFISLRKLNSFVLQAQMEVILGKCMRK